MVHTQRPVQMWTRHPTRSANLTQQPTCFHIIANPYHNLRKVTVEGVNAQPVIHYHRIPREKERLGQHYLPRLRRVYRRDCDRWKIHPPVWRSRLSVQDSPTTEVASGLFPAQRQPKPAVP